MAETYLALLRGVNVGGKNKLPMKALVEICCGIGCGDVRTYIQSGNAIFSADPAIQSTLAALISAEIARRLALRVPVVVRSATELAETVRANPFLEAGAPEEALHVLFLAGQPEAGRVGALDPDRSPPDRFAVRGREVYLWLPNGVAETKLSTAYFDAKLATISTGRNWRTLTTLLGLMTESSSGQGGVRATSA